MTLIEALNAVKNGKTIVSSTGRHYTPEMLRPVWCGKHYASCRSCGMTEIERKGIWRDTHET